MRTVTLRAATKTATVEAVAQTSAELAEQSRATEWQLRRGRASELSARVRRETESLPQLSKVGTNEVSQKQVSRRTWRRRSNHRQATVREEQEREPRAGYVEHAADGLKQGRADARRTWDRNRQDR